MKTAQLVLSEIKLLYISFCNTILNIFPDEEICNRFVRPLLANLLGMRCGFGSVLRKGIYYGNARNIEIGRKCEINRNIFFDAFDRITIGNNVGIAFRCTFITSTHQEGATRKRIGLLFGMPIIIEDGTWIGAEVTIGPGVTVGAGSIVSAGSVLMRSVPPNSLVAGNPARVIGVLPTGEASDEKKTKKGNDKMQ